MRMVKPSVRGDASRSAVAGWNHLESGHHEPASPFQRGVIGELFWVIPDPVLIVTAGRVEAANPAAERLFAVRIDPAGAPAPLDVVCGASAEPVLEMIETGTGGLIRTGGAADLHLDVEVQRIAPGSERSVVILRDVTTEQRYVEGLVRLNEVARCVLTEPSLDVILQRIVDESREITGAAFSALLLLKEGSRSEVARFFYNAPRELFPSRLPRAVGLLGVPIETGGVANIDDIRNHPQGVGIPVEHHPPIGPLLAVPIGTPDVVIGELAVANPPGAGVFDRLDEQMLTELGLSAAEAVGLADARSSMQQSEHARQTLIDVVRHDMATPIAVARGCLDHLNEHGDSLSDEQRHEMFRALDRSVASLERLSANLRSDARLENPSIEEDFADVIVGNLIAELQDHLVDFGAQRNVEVVFRLEEDVPESVRGSHLLIRQAIENLITNAVKHSARDSSVVVTCRKEGDSVRFDIRDRGPGIPVTAQVDLFERFTNTDRGPGSVTGLGIGLSIVRRVAELHGGTVGVSSQPGDGSTFWISLPVVPPQRQKETSH